MPKKRKEAEKLHLWQERLSRNDNAYSAEAGRMDRREEFSGYSHKIITKEVYTP